SVLPLPRLLQHATVGPVELPLDLGSLAGKHADIAALLTASALDLPVEARELELQSLRLELGGLGHRLPSALDDQLGQHPLELWILVQAALTRRGGHRLAQVAARQMARRAPQQVAREILLHVDAREHRRALLGGGDAEGEERALGNLAPRQHARPRAAALRAGSLPTLRSPAGRPPGA